MTSRRIALWSILTLLIFAHSAVAVSVSPDVEFQLDQNTVSYETEKDFDTILVDSNAIETDGNIFSIVSTNPVGITISDFNESYVAYNTSASSDSDVTMQVSQLESGEWSIYSDSTRFDTGDSNSGIVSYSYHDSGLSTHLFELIPTADMQVTTEETVSLGSTALEISQNQNSFYNTITSTVSSGYILGALMVLVLGGGTILRFLGY